MEGLDTNSVVLKEVSFSYPNSDVMIFENINMEVEAGQFVCLLGESGCGKSTLLRLISGLEKPDSGEILIGGIPHKGPGLRKAVVFQDYGLFPWMTAGENIDLALKQKFPDKSNKAIKDTTLAMIEKVGLKPDVYNKLPKELSGGMMQRCAIARAFAIDSPLLLMDEPFGALDAVTRAKLQDLVLELWSQGENKKTVFFVTHDVDEALILADRIFVLGQEGDIIFQTKVSDNQRTARGERFTEEAFQLRNELVQYINRDVISKKEEDEREEI